MVLTFLLHSSLSYFNFLFQLGFRLATELRLTSSQYIRKVTDILSDHRPISLTSIVIKVMERIIHHQLLKAVETNYHNSNSHHGFRHQRSTVTLLLIAVHDWATFLEKRHSVHCVFLDLAKAFDSVPHSRLLLKLENLGIRGNLLSWLKYFLTRRFQRVIINGAFSD